MIVMCCDHHISINYVEWKPGALEFGFHRRTQGVYAYISWNT